MLYWYHGTPEKEWKNSGWILNGVLYPVEYSDDRNGPDKILGRALCKIDALTNPDDYHPDVVREFREEVLI